MPARLIASWTEPGGTADDQLGTIVLTDDGHAWVSRPWGHQLLRLQLAPIGAEARAARPTDPVMTLQRWSAGLRMPC